MTLPVGTIRPAPFITLIDVTESSIRLDAVSGIRIADGPREHAPTPDFIGVLDRYPVVGFWLATWKTA